MKLRAVIVAAAIGCGFMLTACEVPVSVSPSSPAYVAHPKATAPSQCVIEAWTNGETLTAADPPYSTATEWTLGDPGSGTVTNVPCADRSYITVDGHTYWLPGMVERFVNIPGT